MRADIWRTGHGHYFPGRPEQLELTPVEYPAPETGPEGPLGALLVRVDRVLVGLDRHDASLDSIEAALVALRGPA